MRLVIVCLTICAAILLSAPATNAQAPASFDYRGVSLGMTREEFEAVISARNGPQSALSRASCILNDFSRPNPDQYECEDPQDTARYYFSEDDQTPHVMRLRRIIVPGTREDFAPFVEGMDRRFASSATRTAITGGIRWARGTQYVVVKRPPCNEELAGILYRGTCAVYIQQPLQILFDARRRELQRRDF